MIRKGTSLTILMAIVVLMACGRREHPAFFDAVSPRDNPRWAAGNPLPESAMHVRWSPTEVPRQLPADTRFPLAVTFTNTGNQTWPDKNTADPIKSDGGYAVRLCYSLVPLREHVAGSQHIGERIDLVKPVAPGESVTLEVGIRVPHEPGDYMLSFELLQELVVWFADSGADVLTIPVKVVPAGGGGAPTNKP
jgi:hypothetical protein